MYQVLEKAYEQQKVVSVFINREEPFRCNVGYIIGLNETQIALLAIDDDKQPEAILVFPNTDIFRVDMDGKYEDGYRIDENLRRSIYRDFQEICTEKDLILRAFTYSKQQYRHMWVSFIREDELGVVGNVMQIYGNTLKLQRIIKNDGQDDEDGVSFICLDRVDFVACEFR